MGLGGGQVHRDLKWRAVIMRYYYGMNVDAIAFIMGVSERSVYRWWKLFDRTGDVERQVRHVKYGPARKRWPQEVCDFVLEEIKDNPAIYIEEMVEEIKQRYPELRHVSVSTLMRVLRVDLNLSRKLMTHRAQEAKGHRYKAVLRGSPLLVWLP